MRRRTPAMAAARRQRDIRARRLCEQEFLESRARGLLKAAPIVDRDQNSRFRTTLRHDLWAVLEAAIQQFAEACLRILNRPTVHDPPHLG